VFSCGTLIDGAAAKQTVGGNWLAAANEPELSDRRGELSSTSMTEGCDRERSLQGRRAAALQHGAAVVRNGRQ